MNIATSYKKIDVYLPTFIISYQNRKDKIRLCLQRSRNNVIDYTKQI